MANTGDREQYRRMLERVALTDPMGTSLFDARSVDRATARSISGQAERVLQTAREITQLPIAGITTHVLSRGDAIRWMIARTYGAEFASGTGPNKLSPHEALTFLHRIRQADPEAERMSEEAQNFQRRALSLIEIDEPSSEVVVIPDNRDLEEAGLPELGISREAYLSWLLTTVYVAHTIQQQAPDLEDPIQAVEDHIQRVVDAATPMDGALNMGSFCENFTPEQLRQLGTLLHTHRPRAEAYVAFRNAYVDQAARETVEHLHGPVNAQRLAAQPLLYDHSTEQAWVIQAWRDPHIGPTHLNPALTDLQKAPRPEEFQDMHSWKHRHGIT